MPRQPFQNLPSTLEGGWCHGQQKNCWMTTSRNGHPCNAKTTHNGLLHKDWRRISAESSVTFPWWPHHLRDWTIELHDVKQAPTTLTSLPNLTLHLVMYLVLLVLWSEDKNYKQVPAKPYVGSCCASCATGFCDVNGTNSSPHTLTASCSTWMEKNPLSS